MKRSVLTLIDYSRAYDHVQQNSLLLKMLRKDVSPHVIRWIQASLANCQSWVTFKFAKSKKTILKHFVQQGSILSPLLFFFYIDDHYWGSKTYKLASLLMIWTQDNKFHMAEKRLQQSLDTVTTWSKDWKMLLSAQKSECIFFSINSHKSNNIQQRPSRYSNAPKSLVGVKKQVMSGKKSLVRFSPPRHPNLSPHGLTLALTLFS